VLGINKVEEPNSTMPLAAAASIQKATVIVSVEAKEDPRQSRLARMDLSSALSVEMPNFQSRQTTRWSPERVKEAESGQIWDTGSSGWHVVVEA
jgi:hypothetical protein